MAFAVGTEISNLEGGILTPKQIVRFDLRSLIAGKGVFWNQQRLSSWSLMIKPFTEMFMQDANVNIWAKYNFGNYN